MSTFQAVSRRNFLKTAALGLGAASLAGRAGPALAAEPVNFATWSAAVDTVKSHIAAFEAKTGIKVAYSNSPWAQYRETHDHQIHRQGADRHAVGVRQLAARMGGSRVDRAGRPVQVAHRQFGRRPVLRQLHDLQGQAIRHYLLQRLHGVHLQRRRCSTRRASRRRRRAGPKSPARPRPSRTRVWRNGRC